MPLGIVMQLAIWSPCIIFLLFILSFMHVKWEFFALGTTFICSLRLRLGQVVYALYAWSRFTLHCFLLLYVFLFHLLDILECVVLNCILLMVPHLIQKCTHTCCHILIYGSVVCRIWGPFLAETIVKSTPS